MGVTFMRVRNKVGCSNFYCEEPSAAAGRDPMGFLWGSQEARKRKRID
jgi:hypothetical protein